MLKEEQGKERHRREKTERHVCLEYILKNIFLLVND